MLVPYFRRKNILTLLENNEIMTVSDIAQSLGISVSTARRDINLLIEEGTIEKKRGGAFSIKTETKEELPVIDVSEHSENTAKDIIAQIAAKTVKNGDIIFVDSGTTCGMMVKYITARRVTIVTNCVELALKYLPEHGISCILLGGEYYPELYTVNGPLTETQISNMHFNKAYLGANAYSTEHCCTYVDNMRQASIKQLVKDRSEKNYLLAEVSKKSKVGFYKSFDLNDCIIIDESTDENTL